MESSVISPEMWKKHLLVGGFCSNPSEKYDIVSWDDFPFPTEWKVIKFMFQSTNQYCRLMFKEFALGKLINLIIYIYNIYIVFIRVYCSILLMS